MAAEARTHELGPAVAGVIALEKLGQRQPLGGDRRPCDVARQVLELVTLRALRRDARVQREA